MEQPQTKLPETEIPVKCFNSGCKKGSSDNFLLCSGCKKVHYCSEDCQKQNWNDHMFFCGHVSSNGTSSASLDALEYYKKIAVNDPKTQALATEMRLTFPNSTDQWEFAIYMTIRRLVFTGKDTPENISLFFGQNTTGEVDLCHKTYRMHAFLDIPKNSLLSMTAERLEWDKDCPPRNPRSLSDAETQKLQRIREMQDRIRYHMRSLGLRRLRPMDMQEILEKKFGTEWREEVQIYGLAYNSMDRNAITRRSR
ncbi:hypothetical protein F4781DRAFT_444299 [Annulohypoxylon bovei var. microspora]|nr:hypothetical protein F4781DRAFT_444299 [Annulohypoxylon bovei var. microspora]